MKETGANSTKTGAHFRLRRVLILILAALLLLGGAFLWGGRHERHKENLPELSAVAL